MSLLLVLQGAPPSQSMSFGSAAGGATGSPGLFSFVAAFSMTWGAAAGGGTTDPGLFRFTASVTVPWEAASGGGTGAAGAFAFAASYAMAFGSPAGSAVGDLGAFAFTGPPAPTTLTFDLYPDASRAGTGQPDLIGVYLLNYAPKAMTFISPQSMGFPQTEQGSHDSGTFSQGTV